MGPTEEYLRFFAPHLVSAIVLAGDLPCYRAMARAFPRLMFRYDSSIGDYDQSLSSLLESTPLILYEMLTSKQMGRYFPAMYGFYLLLYVVVYVTPGQMRCACYCTVFLSA